MSGIKTLPHGVSRYTNEACRCAECRVAWAAYMSNRRKRKSDLVRANGLPDSVEHGESAYDNWCCRCDVCTAAHSAARRDRERRAQGVTL